MREFTKIQAGGGIVSQCRAPFIGKRAKVLLLAVDSDVCSPFLAGDMPSYALVLGFSSNCFSVLRVLPFSANPKIVFLIVKPVAVPVIYFDTRGSDTRDETVHFDSATYRVNGMRVNVRLPRAYSEDAGVIFVINNRNVTLSQRNFAHLLSLPQRSVN